MKEMSRQIDSLSLSVSRLKSPSSSSEYVAVAAVEVVSNEDLLAEILLHIPVRRLMCLKLVSKQWLSLITSNRFSLLHRRRRRTSAIFLHSEYLHRRGGNKNMVFVHLDLNCVHKNHQKFSDKKNPFRSSIFSHDPFDPSKVCLLQSCNGLLLCRTGVVVNRPEARRGLFYYYIYNPTTNQVATIDRVWEHNATIHASVLHFDPAKSPHYKLVFCVNTSPQLAPKQRQFEFYLSETGTWKVSAHFIPPFDLTMTNFAYFKGCIYWIKSSSRSLNIMLCYNVDEDRLVTLPRPPQRNSRFMRSRNMYFGESAGHLYLAEVIPCAATSLDVYELNCDHSGWFLKYNVDLTRLANDFPEMTHNKHTFDNEYAFCVLSLVRRREDFDEDSVLVLEIPGKLIVYNLVDQSWKEVWNFQTNNARGWFCGIFRAVDYIESLACVTTNS